MPTLTPWFAEVIVVAGHFIQQGYLDAISAQVRLARGRAGTFEVLDFVAILLGYAVSGERTLEAFFEQLSPFALPFMALFGRHCLPGPSTLSRFLTAVDQPCLEALRQLFLHDRLQHGFAGVSRRCAPRATAVANAARSCVLAPWCSRPIPRSGSVRFPTLATTSMPKNCWPPHRPLPPIGFLVRGRDDRRLDHALVQARMCEPADISVTHLETQVQRELFDVGFLSDFQPEQPEAAISYRVLLTRRVAPADPKQVTVGKLRDGRVCELFLTSEPASSLSAATVLELYQQRGSFEQVLSDEDEEQDLDRWCSRTPCGQEFAQILGQ